MVTCAEATRQHKNLLLLKVCVELSSKPIGYRLMQVDDLGKFGAWESDTDRKLEVGFAVPLKLFKIVLLWVSWVLCIFAPNFKQSQLSFNHYGCHWAGDLFMHVHWPQAIKLQAVCQSKFSMVIGSKVGLQGQLLHAHPDQATLKSDAVATDNHHLGRSLRQQFQQ